jgi:hypothetical protein
MFAYYDRDADIVLAVRMVVDGLEGRAIAEHCRDQPLSASIVDLSLCMPLFDGSFNSARIPSTRYYAHVRVIGPDESLDVHIASLSRGTDASSLRRGSRERPEHGSIFGKVVG